MTGVFRFLTAIVIGLWLAGGALAVAQEKPKPAADPITGVWEGTVELPDGAMPFTMTLKLEGAKVTGEVGSVQGAAPITEGAWVDGKLTIAFTYVDGAAVQMTGVAANGALSGSLSYGGGQMVATWAAKKKIDK
jgi:hypothetical protein